MRYFFTAGIGLPGILVATMRLMPVWPKLTALAHTLPYDAQLIAHAGAGRPLPADRWPGVTVPALILAGGKSPAWMRNSMRSLATVLPQRRALCPAGPDPHRQARRARARAQRILQRPRRVHQPQQRSRPCASAPPSSSTARPPPASPSPDQIVTALGGGSRPQVCVTLAGYSYQTTVARMRGEFKFPVSAAVREHADVAAGDEVDVDIEFDTQPRELAIPADLAEALGRDPDAKKTFERLSYTNQKRHVLAVEGAKTPETRQRRIAKALAGPQPGRRG